MRAFLAVALILVLAGAALALTHSTAHSSARATLLASHRACSVSTICTRGCSLEVEAKAPGGSPTGPCASQATIPCIEDVTAAPPHVGPPGTRVCAGSPTRPPGRLLPRGANKLRPRAERYLHSHQQRP